jgi:hypothetical protein
MTFHTDFMLQGERRTLLQKLQTIEVWLAEGAAAAPSLARAWGGGRSIVRGGRWRGGAPHP